MPEGICTKNTIEPAYRDTKDNLLLKFNSSFFEGDKQLRLRTVRMGSAQSSNFPMCTFWFYCPCFGSFVFSSFSYANSFSSETACSQWVYCRQNLVVLGKRSRHLSSILKWKVPISYFVKTWAFFNLQYFNFQTYLTFPEIFR